MARCIPRSRGLIAAAAALVWFDASGQTATTLEKVTITGSSDPSVGVGGWANVPLSKSPFQASVINSEQLRDLGIQRLADVTRVDPSVSDAYNAEGYWDFLTVRGFVLDNRYNFRRDGLPINAETSIPLDNKERIELLKGTSGIQAGTSAPGGLANFVVKRPGDEPVRNVQFAWRQPGSVLGAVDLSQRFGDARAFGLRVNAAAERLDPYTRSTKGERQLLAVAADWRLTSDTLLEAEFETSHRRQPSVPGFSLLGASVPAPVDPRINLNNQPWTLPVVFDGNTASLRFSQRLAEGWRWTAHAATQRLKTDDRIAFPFGCGAEGNFDRYCSDGTFDFYDYRSENERRRTDAFNVELQGEWHTGGVRHATSTGVLRSAVHDRFGLLAFNFAGVGNVDGSAVTSPMPALGPGIPNRDEHSTELYLRDAMRFGPRVTGWLGVRHTRLHRSTSDTDYRQSFTTPWLAASFELSADTLAYASWGRGIESAVAPALPLYTNRGQPLPALQSRQYELGLKGSTISGGWSLAWFDISRPAFADFGTCDADATCTRQVDGVASHRGVEANVGARWGAWSLQGGLQALRARRERSQTAAINGLRPTNVPALTLKLQGRYEVAAVRGLSMQAGLVAESDRIVLEDNSARIPGHARVDVGARYTQGTRAGSLTFRAGIDNLFDRRAWKESPFEFSHVYLFPLAPRTVRLSVEAAL
ncbi:TonB-dependent siderophore receptor [Piscinibacter sp.]|uniref:TonB-dependent siderophore receptor n=1 Tax=Piscinibacter sp. TaxID=1903157 RepID=UPI002F40E5E4